MKKKKQEEKRREPQVSSAVIPSTSFFCLTSICFLCSSSFFSSSFFYSFHLPFNFFLCMQLISFSFSQFFFLLLVSCFSRSLLPDQVYTYMTYIIITCINNMKASHHLNPVKSARLVDSFARRFAGLWQFLLH